MDVEEEVEIKKKLDEQRRRLQKIRLRDLREDSCVCRNGAWQSRLNRTRGSWTLQDIEQKTECISGPEHQTFARKLARAKIQKRPGVGEEIVETEEVACCQAEEIEASSYRMAAEDLEEELGGLQAGEERRGS